MFTFLLFSVVFVVIRASPHNHVRDDLFMQDLTGEDSSVPVEPANTNIFNDGTFVSSAAFPDDDSTGDLFLNPVDGGSVGMLDFGQDFDGKERPVEENFDPSLLDINGEGEESLVGNIAFAADNNDADEDFPIDFLDSSMSTTPCKLRRDSSIESFDSSSLTTLSDPNGIPDLIASDDSTPETPDVPDAARHAPSWRYTIEPIYELGPDIGPTVDTTDAYAADGTAIKPSRCPSGMKKSCCTDNTHTACWYYPRNAQLCRYARNLYCCDEVPRLGGPGIGCQTIKWVYERSRPRRNPSSNQPDPFEGIFDIFHFPDLNPNSNPSFCPSPSRF